MRKTIVFITVLLTLLFFLPASYAQTTGVIFEDNFDNHPDWTIQQPVFTDPGIDECYLNCDTPSGWDSYYNGGSFCNGGPGYNNIYLNGDNPRGGSGKSLTFWDESCYDGFSDSDGQLGKYLGQNYQELYVRFYIKFDPNYKWMTDGTPQHKIMRVWYYKGMGTPYVFFDSGNQPGFGIGLHTYRGNLWYYASYRCETNYYCQGTPSYNFDVGHDQDHLPLGPIETTLMDGNWHSMEAYLKMNTNNGTTFNADGIHRLWVDGKLVYEATNIPWSDNGSTVDPRRGFNYISFGGNNNNRWTRNCVGTECEQWYAIDDVVISTEYIGPDYVIGAPKTWQQTLEQNFDIVDTFDELQDWIGIKAGSGDVIDANDMPKRQNGDPSIWNYYSSYKYTDTGRPWIGDFGYPYVWRGIGKSLRLQMFDAVKADTLPAYSKKEDSPGKFGLYFGDRDMPNPAQTGYDEIYVFFMTRINSNLLPKDQTGTYLFLPTFKFTQMSSGFRDIWHWGSVEEYNELLRKGALTQELNVYGMNFIIPTLNRFGPYGFCDWQPGLHNIFTYTSKADKTGYQQENDIRRAGCLNGYMDKWMGIEFRYTKGIPGQNNGGTAVWFYDENGNEILMSEINSLVMMREYDHKWNKFVFGGNMYIQAADYGNIPDNSVDPDYYFDDFIIDNERIGPTYFSLLNGITPPPPLKGDVQCDKVVDILDVQALVNCILGTGDCDWGCGNSADVNRDGFVDVLDVQEVVNVILGG